jgi:hypothetical protein
MADHGRELMDEALSKARRDERASSTSRACTSTTAMTSAARHAPSTWTPPDLQRPERGHIELFPVTVGHRP